MMDTTQYQALLAKYLKGDCTDEERALLDAWYASLDTDAALPATETEKRQLLVKNWEGVAQRTVQRRPTKRYFITPYQAAAATVALVAGLSWYVVKQTHASLAAPAEITLTNQPSFVKRINTTAHPEQMLLSDQSVVTLQPGSTIRFPAIFAAHRREVILVGEAFFEVQKNPGKPFFVYANDVVTKVLGTSFRIKALPTEQNVTVSVRTGRVSVYSLKLTTKEKTKSDPETIGVVLTPNQQATYLTQEHRLIKTLVDNPIILPENAQQTSFIFQNAPLATIIAAIEKTYGVDIFYDEELMRNCFITTSLNQENLHDKLAIICRLLGATYKVIDAQIVITGPGC